MIDLVEDPVEMVFGHGRVDGQDQQRRCQPSRAIFGGLGHDGGMTGNIIRLQRGQGVGALLGDDGKTYSFRRSDVRDAWFHDLSEGVNVSFEAGLPPRQLEATLVRPARPAV
jgi:cold shock CspA family protein